MYQATVPLSEARRTFFRLAENIKETGRIYTLTRDGLPMVVMMPVADFEEMVETLELHDEYPELLKAIAKAKREAQRGETMDIKKYFGVKNKKHVSRKSVKGSAKSIG